MVPCCVRKINVKQQFFFARIIVRPAEYQNILSMDFPKEHGFAHGWFHNVWFCLKFFRKAPTSCKLVKKKNHPTISPLYEPQIIVCQATDWQSKSLWYHVCIYIYTYIDMCIYIYIQKWSCLEYGLGEIQDGDVRSSADSLVAWMWNRSRLVVNLVDFTNTGKHVGYISLV